MNRDDLGIGHVLNCTCVERSDHAATHDSKSGRHQNLLRRPKISAKTSVAVRLLFVISDESDSSVQRANAGGESKPSDITRSISDREVKCACVLISLYQRPRLIRIVSGKIL